MEFTGTTAALHLLDHLLHGHDEDARPPRSRYAHVLRRTARQPGRRRGGARGRTLPPLERSAVSARGARGRPSSGGRRQRRPRAFHAHARPERIVEAASRRRTPPRRETPRRHRGRLLPRPPRGDDPQLGRRNIPSHLRWRARPEPQLAGRLGTRGRQPGAGPFPTSEPRCARSSRRSSSARTSPRTSATTPSRASISARGRGALTTTSLFPTCVRSRSWARRRRA